MATKTSTEMKDWFKTGLAVGDKMPKVSDLITQLLEMKQLCPQAQFFVAGTLVGFCLEDPWKVLEMAEKGPGE